MRAFIVLCLVAVAFADKLGYNYQPVAHSSAGLSFQPGSVGSSESTSYSAAAAPSSSAPAAPAYSAPAASSYSAPAVPSYSAPAAPSYSAPAAPSYSAPAAPSYSAPAVSSYSAPAASSYSAPSYSAPAAPSYSAPAAPTYSAPAAAPAPVAPAAVEYEKEFYTFSGPEQQNDDSAALRQQLESGLKKHLRVIFIKNTEDSGLENAALSLAQHAAEQKTAIYVLNKQPDLGDLANKLNNISKNNSLKPEVHFVKYRTQEDATNAQNAIQAQYDQLGGSSLSHNGDAAPLLNFASPTAAVKGADPQSPKNSYLPASVFRY